MKIVHIVGTRPHFVKMAVLSRAIEEHNKNCGDPPIHEIFIHTGQHYDYEMSQVFFEEFQAELPTYNLEVKTEKDGEMIGTMLTKAEVLLIKENPDLVLVYGNTNSTLAGVLAANKLNIPTAHIEAGVRSYNRKMPEETNRVVADHLSDYLFCPTNNAVVNLAKEGIIDGVFYSGDVMYDSFLHYRNKISQSQIFSKLQIKPDSYCLATIHRQENMEHLEVIFDYFEHLVTSKCPFIIPLHPKTRKFIEQNQWEYSPYIKFILPIGYFDMLALESGAKVILTDSGGVQKEAYFAGVPCVTVRGQTEWPEIVDVGWNFLSGTFAIISAFERATQFSRSKKRPTLFGNGIAGKFIIKKLIEVL